MKIKVISSVVVLTSPLLAMDEWSGLVLFKDEGSALIQTPEQRAAAWRIASEHVRPPRETFWYHRIYQPHKQALINADKAFKEAGIRDHVFLRTTYEGLHETSEKLFPNVAAALVTAQGIYLGPQTLQFLISRSRLGRARGEHVLFHEYTHWVKRHVQKNPRGGYVNALALRASPEIFNRTRQYEYEADLGAYSMLATNKLLVLRQGYMKEGIEKEPVLHPTSSERLMMINEELEARKTGRRLAMTELPSWKSFSARNKKI